MTQPLDPIAENQAAIDLLEKLQRDAAPYVLTFEEEERLKRLIQTYRVNLGIVRAQAEPRPSTRPMASPYPLFEDRREKWTP